MMRLENLKANFQGVQIDYADIVNYEIARENICGYIFLLSRKSKSAAPPEKIEIENQITNLIHYRDNLQIEDKDNIQRVLKELIPEYQKAVPV